MANRHNQHIDSPVFKEFAYRAFKGISPAQKEGLSLDELKIFVSDHALLKFCKEERMDHVMSLLAKLGYEWTFRIHLEEQAADTVEFNTTDQYTYPQKRVDLIEATVRAGMCVISSRDVINLSHMVAQNCGTKVYELSDFSKNLKRAGSEFGHLKKWDNEVGKAQEAHNLFNEILLEQLNSFDYAEDILGLEADDIRILAALYKKRNAAVKMIDISELTKAKGRKMYFRIPMEKLLRKGYVTSDVKETKKVWANTTYFMITTKGIDAIMKYRKFVFQNVFGA